MRTTIEAAAISVVTIVDLETGLFIRIAFFTRDWLGLTFVLLPLLLARLMVKLTDRPTDLFRGARLAQVAIGRLVPRSADGHSKCSTTASEEKNEDNEDDDDDDDNEKEKTRRQQQRMMNPKRLAYGRLFST